MEVAPIFAAAPVATGTEGAAEDEDGATDAEALGAELASGLYGDGGPVLPANRRARGLAAV